MKTKTIAAFVTFSLMLPFAALAQYGSVNANVSVNANAGVHATNAHVSAQLNVRADVITRAKDRADQELTRRVDNLTNMETRISAAARITADGKQTLTSTITTQISALQQLKSQIDAETSTTSLKDEVKSITTSYRVYALIMPQLAIIAAADRVADVADAMNILAGKLDARVTASSTANATAALADMKAKAADAQTQTNAAVNAVISLKPDNGDKTVMQQNETALKDARSKIQAAQQDLVASRKDVRTLLQGLHINASGTAGTTTDNSATSTTGGQ